MTDAGKRMPIKHDRGSPSIVQQEVMIGIGRRVNPDLGSGVGIPYGTQFNRVMIHLEPSRKTVN